MLPKHRRLRASEVREVLARGRSQRCGPYRCKFLEGDEPLRTAVVVSKKVARSSVERNRLRRQGYREVQSLPLPRAGRLVLFIDRVQS